MKLNSLITRNSAVTVAVTLHCLHFMAQFLEATRVLND